MNRLKKEKSPYLLQHSGNPVDWYPWSEEAFEIAKSQDKPIFLSIGYATCHWCHVMEHESFEDPEVAELMNSSFVNIKVDREERPDIDNTYMTVCQMITGQGGWPLTIIMTPEKKPFYAATYIPKTSRFQQVGMTDLVPAISNAWSNERSKILEAVSRIEQGFSRSLELGKGDSTLPEDITEQTFQELSNRFDPLHGGFGSSPKFPSAHNLLFLMNHYRSTGNREALQMASHTLTKMRLGGIWDHIGYGFHRYSTDNKWLLPHFEKMLYDQAMLMTAYAEAWKETRNPLFKKTVSEIAEYIEQHLTSPEGLFYSAQDADSEGEEGKFYIWTSDEIQQILTEKESALFLDLFRFQEDGNFMDEVSKKKTGRNISHLEQTYEKMASRLEMDIESLLDQLDSSRNKIFKVRSKRVHPILDDKVLTDWNGLMIAAMAKAGTLIDNDALIKKAQRAWSQLASACMTDDYKLLHRYKDQEAAIDGMADDYSFVILGLLELYNATFQPNYLITAIELQNSFDKIFKDEKFGGYYFTSKNSEVIMGRQKEIYDGAIPSSNSVTAMNGYRLSAITSDPKFSIQSDQIFRAFCDPIADAPSGYTYAMSALLAGSGSTTQIIITSQEWNQKLEMMVKEIRVKASTDTTIIVITEEWRIQLSEWIPFINNYPIGDSPTFYICRNYQCKRPVYRLTEAIDLLDTISKE